MSDLLTRIRNHIAALPPHALARSGGQLLCEAGEELAKSEAEVDRLQTIISDAHARMEGLQKWPVLAPAGSRFGS